MCFTVFIFKAKKISGASIVEQKIPFRMVVFSTLQLMYNLKNLDLKYVNFESKSSKIGEKVVGFCKKKIRLTSLEEIWTSNLFEKQDTDQDCLR